MEQATAPETRQPWERQDGESAQAYAAFACYRDMDPAVRSHKAVSEKLKKSETLIGRWSSPARWRWTERIEAFEREQERVFFREMRMQWRVSGRKHAALGRLLLALGANGLKEAMEHATLTTGQRLDLIREGIRLERLALGIPTEIEGQVTLPSQGPDEYELLKAIAADPEARALAQRLAERLETQPGRVRGAPQPGPVDPAQSPAADRGAHSGDGAEGRREADRDPPPAAR